MSPPPLDELLFDLARLLPDDERHAVLQGARLRRQSLALAKRLGVTPSAEAIRAASTRFRRARGLTRAEALSAWCRARELTPEGFARLMVEEATLAATGDAGDLSPADLAGFLLAAEGSDPLWSQALAARAHGGSDAPPLELLHGWYESRLGTLVPDEERIDRDAQAHGFDGLDELVGALARTTAPRAEARVAVARGDALPDFVLRHPDAGDINGSSWLILRDGEKDAILRDFHFRCE